MGHMGNVSFAMNLKLLLKIKFFKAHTHTHTKSKCETQRGWKAMSGSQAERVAKLGAGGGASWLRWGRSKHHPGCPTEPEGHSLALTL